MSMDTLLDSLVSRVLVLERRLKELTANNPPVLDNRKATTAPTVNDDVGDGYSVSSIWIDTSTDTFYICADNTSAAAVWINSGSAGGGSPVQITGPLTPFGEVQAESKTPVVQIDFVYNINSRVTNTTTTGSGTVTQGNAMAVVDCAAATSSSATLESRRLVKYHPGQGVTVRFTALFGTPTTGNQQLAGVGDADNGLFFGTDASGNFGIIRRSDGTDNFINKTAWNIDKLDGNTDPMVLDTSKLNVYEIGFQYLGAGSIIFRVEGDTNSDGAGQFIDVHRIDYTNANTEPHMYNPSFPMHLSSTNTTNNTSIVVKSASMSAFVDGKDVILGEGFIASGSATSITTETSILTIHSKTTFASKTNHSRASIGYISVSVSGPKLTTVTVYHDATPSGVSYSDVDTNTSFMEFSTTQSTTISGGHKIMEFNLGTDSDEVIPLTEFQEFLYPDETLLFSATSSGAGSDVKVTVRWEEDI